MAEGFPVFGWKQSTNHVRDMSGARAHLARIEERPQALRPQAVLRAVPAVPAIEARVHHGGRVPVDELEAEGARPRILEAAEGRVAGGAQHRARAREPRLEKELLAERDRRGLSGDAVRRIGPERRRPGPMLKYLRDLLGGEIDSGGNRNRVSRAVRRA